MAKRKKKEPSYEDYVANLAKLEEELTAKQKEIADAKKKKEEAEEKEGNKLGNALIKKFPEILEDMQNEKLSKYITSKKFANMIYSAFKEEEKKAAEQAPETMTTSEGYNAFANDGANNGQSY